jgi:hypothetical protein
VAEFTVLQEAIQAMDCLVVLAPVVLVILEVVVPAPIKRVQTGQAVQEEKVVMELQVRLLEQLKFMLVEEVVDQLIRIQEAMVVLAERAMVVQIKQVVMVILTLEAAVVGVADCKLAVLLGKEEPAAQA